MISFWEPNEEKWLLSFFLKTLRLLLLDFRGLAERFVKILCPVCVCVRVCVCVWRGGGVGVYKN